MRSIGSGMALMASRSICAEYRELLTVLTVQGTLNAMALTETPIPTCRTCHEQVVWADDIAAMVDRVCGDCQEEG
jgi:hypothetical protein